MAVTQNGLTTATGGFGTSASVASPATVVAGEVWLIQVVLGSIPATVTPPAGFTLIWDSSATGTYHSCRMLIYTYTATGSETAGSSTWSSVTASASTTYFSTTTRVAGSYGTPTAVGNSGDINAGSYLVTSSALAAVDASSMVFVFTGLVLDHSSGNPTAGEPTGTTSGTLVGLGSGYTTASGVPYPAFYGTYKAGSLVSQTYQVQGKGTYPSALNIAAILFSGDPPATNGNFFAFM